MPWQGLGWCPPFLVEGLVVAFAVAMLQGWIFKRSFGACLHAVCSLPHRPWSSVKSLEVNVGVGSSSLSKASSLLAIW